MKGTILDSELRPEQFNEVTCAIFQKLDQGKLFSTINLILPSFTENYSTINHKSSFLMDMAMLNSESKRRSCLITYVMCPTFLCSSPTLS